MGSPIPFALFESLNKKPVDSVLRYGVQNLCMRIFLMCAAICSVVLAAEHPDFSGTWELTPTKSRNIGMMAQMKLTSVVTQTGKEIVIVNQRMGQAQGPETRFDLTGAVMKNETPMGDKAETVSKWDGDKLVTTWTSPGSVAGTQVVRTETRWLSPDRRTMTVESARGKSDPMVMVYERK